MAVIFSKKFDQISMENKAAGAGSSFPTLLV